MVEDTPTPPSATAVDSSNLTPAAADSKPAIADASAQLNGNGTSEVSNGIGGHDQTTNEPATPEAAKEGSTYGNVSQCFLCGQPATTQCAVCRLVGFCGPAHGQVHRPEGFCFPFMVEQRPERGRCLVAVRDIEPLELVLWDSAAAMGPRMGSATVCLQCLKALPPAKNKEEEKKQRCSACGWPVCGPDCEKGPAHRIECPALAEAAKRLGRSTFPSESIANGNGGEDVNEAYRAIAPLRLLLVKAKLPEMWERLTYLMDHNKERQRADPELWAQYQRHVNEFLKSSLGGASSADGGTMAFTDADIDRATGLLWTNCFACAAGGGQALFPTFSFASHSCRPNCTHSVFPNRTLALQAKTVIAAGEEFTISYISTVQGLLKRRVKLRDKWFFECGCERCCDPSELGSHASTHLCQVCRQRRQQGESGGEGYVMSRDPQDPVAPWACNTCGLLTPAATINEIENRIAGDMQKIDNTSLVAFEEIHGKILFSMLFIF
jgi:SET domain